MLSPRRYRYRTVDVFTTRQLEGARRFSGSHRCAGGAVAPYKRAFADDPLLTHVLSDPVERERLMPPFMTAWTRYGLLFGEVYVTAGPVDASATEQPRNVPLYQRYGFEIAVEGDLPGGGPHFWFMRRKSRLPL